MEGLSQALAQLFINQISSFCDVHMIPTIASDIRQPFIVSHQVVFIFFGSKNERILAVSMTKNRKNNPFTARTVPQLN